MEGSDDLPHNFMRNLVLETVPQSYSDSISPPHSLRIPEVALDSSEDGFATPVSATHKFATQDSSRDSSPSSSSLVPADAARPQKPSLAGHAATATRGLEKAISMIQCMRGFFLGPEESQGVEQQNVEHGSVASRKRKSHGDNTDLGEQTPDFAPTSKRQKLEKIAQGNSQYLCYFHWIVS